MNIRCLFGHDFVSLGLFQLRDIFSNEIVVGLGKCQRCGKTEIRALASVTPGEIMDFYLRFENAKHVVE